MINIKGNKWKSNSLIYVKIVILVIITMGLSWIGFHSIPANIWIFSKTSTIAGFKFFSLKGLAGVYIWIVNSVVVAKAISFGDKARRLQGIRGLVYTIIAGIFIQFILHWFYKGDICNEDTSGLVSFIAQKPVKLNITSVYFAVTVVLCVVIYGYSVVIKAIDRLCKDFRLTVEKVKTILTVLVLVLSPILCQLICDINRNTEYSSIGLNYILFGSVLAVLLEFFLYFISNRHLCSLIPLYVLYWFGGVVDYFVMKFRGTPFMVSDFSSIFTAMNVVESYSIVPNDAIVFSTILMFFIFSIIVTYEKLSCKLKDIKIGISNAHNEVSTKWIYRCIKKLNITNTIVAIVSLAMMFYWIFGENWSKEYGISFSWNPSGEYNKYGFMTAFVLSGKNMKADKPEGYSESRLIEILGRVSNYDNGDEKATQVSVEPTVIGIMNEAFADLEIYGSALDTSSDLAFFHSLKDDPGTLEYGWNYVSVFGGMTADTEYEVLTGNSIKFVGEVVPYNTYNFSNVLNIASTMKRNGYDTLAFHPSFGSNYKRNSVYKQMGFDEFRTSEDLDGTGVTRGYYSDWRDYDYLIYWHRTREKTNPLFAFNVTIQNHGGYSISEIEKSGLPVSEVDEKYSLNDDLVAYESLLYQSDRALEYLISYFKDADDPVILFFFWRSPTSLV